MRFKTIVAILQNEQDAERVLDCAIPLASRFESHLIGIHAEALPVPYTSATGFPDTEFLQVSADMNRERADKLQAVFLRRIEDSGLSFEWRSLESFSGDSALTGISSVRAADLIIAAQRDTGGDPSADVDTLVYDAGRPVLVVPHAGSAGHHLQACAARLERQQGSGARRLRRPALHHRGRENRHIWSSIRRIRSTKARRPPAPKSRRPCRATAPLSASRCRNRAASRSTTSSRTRIAETGADLLVLGAYSHSWLRQLLFGGVTRTVLRTTPVAAFLSR